MYKFLTLFCTLSSLILITDSCKSVKEQSTTLEEADVPGNQQVDQLAEMRLGTPFQIEWNESKNYALVTKKVKIRMNDPYPTVRFFIYDRKADEVIYENTEVGGNVVWESDQVVHVSSAIGIPNPDVKKTKPNEYRYHVVNKKKYSGKFFKNN